MSKNYNCPEGMYSDLVEVIGEENKDLMNELTAFLGHCCMMDKESDRERCIAEVKASTDIRVSKELLKQRLRLWQEEKKKGIAPRVFNYTQRDKAEKGLMAEEFVLGLFKDVGYEAELIGHKLAGHGDLLVSEEPITLLIRDKEKKWLVELKTIDEFCDPSRPSHCRPWISRNSHNELMNNSFALDAVPLYLVLVEFNDYKSKDKNRLDGFSELKFVPVKKVAKDFSEGQEKDNLKIPWLDVMSAENFDFEKFDKVD